MKGTADLPRATFQKAVLLAVLVTSVTAIVWWTRRPTPPLDATGVNALYAASREAILARDVGAYCALIAADFQGFVTATGAGEEVSLKMDRAQACKQMGDLLELASANARNGSSQPLNVHLEIVQILPGSDTQEKQVITSYRIELVNHMVLTGASRDRLRLRANDVRLVESHTFSRTEMR